VVEVRTYCAAIWSSGYDVVLQFQIGVEDRGVQLRLAVESVSHAFPIRCGLRHRNVGSTFIVLEALALQTTPGSDEAGSEGEGPGHEVDFLSQVVRAKHKTSRPLRELATPSQTHWTLSGHPNQSASMQRLQRRICRSCPCLVAVPRGALVRQRGPEERLSTASWTSYYRTGCRA